MGASRDLLTERLIGNELARVSAYLNWFYLTQPKKSATCLEWVLTLSGCCSFPCANADVNRTFVMMRPAASWILPSPIYDYCSCSKGVISCSFPQIRIPNLRTHALDFVITLRAVAGCGDIWPSRNIG